LRLIKICIFLRLRASGDLVMLEQRPNCATAYAEPAAALRENGFAVMRSCIDGVALRELVDEYEKSILPNKHTSDVRREVYGPEGKDGLARVMHVSNVHEVTRLGQLAADPNLLQLASACFGGVPVRPIINTELFDKPSCGNSSTQTPPHQDNFYFKALEPGIAVWIALEEMDVDSGTVQYVRGSHLRGLRFHDWDWGPAGFAKTIQDFTDEDEELLEDVGHLNPGDVVVHHGLTIHYAPPNMTSGRRRGLVVNYIAEHAAYTLADDLYKPALTFHFHETGSLVAAVPKDWPERHALAAACVKCALAGQQGLRDGIDSSVHVDSLTGKLFVEVSDPDVRREAVIALVRSGHVVHNGGLVRAMPVQLGIVRFDSVPKMLPRSRLPDEYLGVWKLRQKEVLLGGVGEMSDLALRLQAPSGIYVDIHIPKLMLKMRLVDLETCMDPLARAEQRASAGWLSPDTERQDIATRHGCIAFHPFNGAVDVCRTCSTATDSQTLVETSMPDCAVETWMRVDGQSRLDAVVTLELIADADGRLGFWVVSGSWFGRVVGRQSGDILNDVVCKSLPHAIRSYADEWQMEPEALVQGFEATFGRVESPGIFRILHDLDATREGSLLLDNSKQQLRRDAGESDVLLETWSARRWRIKESSGGLAALGKLKRHFGGQLQVDS